MNGHNMIFSWLKKIIWVIGVLRKTVVSDGRFDNLCGSHLQSLWRWLPHRLSKRQSLTTVLVRTPITQVIFFNQVIIIIIIIIIIMIMIMIIIIIIIIIIIMITHLKIDRVCLYRRNRNRSNLSSHKCRIQPGNHSFHMHCRGRKCWISCNWKQELVFKPIDHISNCLWINYISIAFVRFQKHRFPSNTQTKRGSMYLKLIRRFTCSLQWSS